MYRNLHRKPWSYGYNDVRWELISDSISDNKTLDFFAQNKIPTDYAKGFDERPVEYPWLFSRFKDYQGHKILDAGSTLNFTPLVNHPYITANELYIYTFYPEHESFNSKRISYVYGDLRSLPFRDNFFDVVICQSTLEHIDMDNSMYGYELNSNKDVMKKSYEYVKVISELKRVLKTNGKLLITVPYGKFENHGFFQQFDAEMLSRITTELGSGVSCVTCFYKYMPQGWTSSTADECEACESYNPHTGIGKGTDGAAHSRAIACIEYIK